MVKILKKRKSKINKLKTLMENAEEIAISETENTVEDLRDMEVSRDCFSEGDVEDKDVISRVKLF